MQSLGCYFVSSLFLSVWFPRWFFIKLKVVELHQVKLKLKKKKSRENDMNLVLMMLENFSFQTLVIKDYIFQEDELIEGSYGRWGMYGGEWLSSFAEWLNFTLSIPLTSLRNSLTSFCFQASPPPDHFISCSTSFSLAFYFSVLNCSNFHIKPHASLEF